MPTLTQSDFNKVAGEMAEYIQLMDQAMHEKDQVINSLRQEVIQKEAYVAPTLDRNAVVGMVDRCIEAGFIKEADRELSVDAALANPGELVTFLDKLAAKTVENDRKVKPLGRGRAQKVASAGEQRESDRLFESKFG